MIKKLLWIFPLFAIGSVCAQIAPLPPELATYLSRDEPQSDWKLETKSFSGNCDYWHIKLQSQVWQKIPWKHDLIIFLPQGTPANRKMVLFNEGGTFKPGKLIYGTLLANKLKAPVALLLGIPSQPLFGKVEDDLIAETFVQYIATEDASWPLLFPMVKSVVKSMDIIGEFSSQEWDLKTDQFILTGASKRGWTTWLAAASDPRITAIAPMVIDVLNIPAQLPLQIDRFGKPSEQIAPYTNRGLIPLGEKPAAKRLWTMVDPYTYREKFTMPKLILLGNNDLFWSTDALNLYWDDLPDEKHISYTPNAGHNLMEVSATGVTETLPTKALDNLAAFVRSQFNGKPFPKLHWKHGDAADGNFTLEITADQHPNAARLWFAKSETKDFRKARWESRSIDLTDGKPITTLIEKPATGYISFYADLNYDFGGSPLWLCTQLRLTGAD